VSAVNEPCDSALPNVTWEEKRPPPWWMRVVVVGCEIVIALALLTACAPWLWVAEAVLRFAPLLALLLVVAMAICRKRAWHAAAAVVALVVLAWPHLRMAYRAPAPQDHVRPADSELRVLSMDLRDWSGDESTLAALREAVISTHPHLVVAVLADDEALVDVIKDLPEFPFEVPQPMRPRHTEGGDEDRDPVAWGYVLARSRMGDWTNHFFSDGSALAGDGVITFSDGAELHVVTAVPPRLRDPRGFPGRAELAQEMGDVLVPDDAGPALVVAPAGWTLVDPAWSDLVRRAGLQVPAGSMPAVMPGWAPEPLRVADSMIAVRGAACSRPETITLPGSARLAVLVTVRVPRALSDR